MFNDWLSIWLMPLTWAIPEPDYWKIWFENTMESAVIPSITGC